MKELPIPIVVQRKLSVLIKCFLIRAEPSIGWGCYAYMRNFGAILRRMPKKHIFSGDTRQNWQKSRIWKLQPHFHLFPQRQHPRYINRNMDKTSLIFSLIPWYATHTPLSTNTSSPETTCFNGSDGSKNHLLQWKYFAQPHYTGGVTITVCAGDRGGEMLDFSVPQCFPTIPSIQQFTFRGKKSTSASRRLVFLQS